MARVLVTGCNSGFGLGAVRMFAERGDTVYATVRNPDQAGELVALKEQGYPVHIMRLDVRDDQRAAEVVNEILAEGGIDVLVNNAGVSMFAAVEEVSVDLAREMMEVNLFGPLSLIQLVLPSMRRQGHGRIVNVSSIAGFAPLGYMSTYSMSKQALDALSFCLAAELAPFGIKVSVISPGGFATAVGGKLWNADRQPDAPEYRAMVQQLVSGYHVHVATRPPDVVSAAIVAAAHDEAPVMRQFIGDDAEKLAELRRQLDDAGWARNMLPVPPG